MNAILDTLHEYGNEGLEFESKTKITQKQYERVIDLLTTSKCQRLDDTNETEYIGDTDCRRVVSADGHE